MSRFSRRHRAYAVLVAASAVGVVTLLTTFGANAGAAAVGDSRPVAAGREPAHRLGQILCVPDFPSASRPLLDFTVIHGGRSDVTQDRVWRSEGIAADGVHEVAFRTPDGRTVGATPVVQNIYSVASVPSERVTDLIAKDAKGSVIAKLPTSR